MRPRSLKTTHPPKSYKRSITVNRNPEHKWRKDLILTATLAVSLTYQAGLLPPGGLWPDDQDGHLTGDPILHDTDPTRYKVFFYCNTTAFVASVVIVILLLNSTISKYKRSLLAMKTAMVLDLLALLGAFAAGSCRKSTTSVYVLALVIAVFIYIVIHILLSFNKMARSVRNVGEQWIPCLKKIWALIETEPSNHQPSTEEP
jgi:predicted RND superfamily exporter protein